MDHYAQAYRVFSKIRGYRRFEDDGTFTDVTMDAGFVDEACNIIKGLSSSAFWADLDNDGHLDLYVVNFGAFENAPNWYYHNNGDGTFTEMAVSAGIECMVEGRGDTGVVGDYNNDGFLDIFITNGRTYELFGQGPYVLYKNDGNDNNWLEIKTIGTISNRDGIGSKVKVTTGGMVQFREQNGGSTLYGQNSNILHFGLGSATTVDRIEIAWPSGKTQEFLNVAANQILTVREPGVTWSEVISAYNEYIRWEDMGRCNCCISIVRHEPGSILTVFLHLSHSFLRSSLSCRTVILILLLKGSSYRGALHSRVN